MSVFGLIHPTVVMLSLEAVKGPSKIAHLTLHYKLRRHVRHSWMAPCDGGFACLTNGRRPSTLAKRAAQTQSALGAWVYAASRENDQRLVRHKRWLCSLSEAVK